MLTRRALIVGGAAATFLWALASHAEPAWPSKPVTIVVPTPPGGMLDALARLLAQRLAEPLSQPVVVDNRAGASTMVATHAVARAPADGHTLLLNVTQLVQNPLLYKKPGYDAFKDFAPVIRIGAAVTVLSGAPDAPVKDLKELVAKAKANPTPLSYGTQGIGSSHHIYTEILGRQTGLKLNHVPYRGEAPMLPDLMAGRLNLGWLSGMSALQYASEGKVKLLAATGRKRPVALPDVPTFAELGYTGLDSEGWVGILAPAGTPKPVIDRLSKELDHIIALPAVRERLVSFGIDPTGRVRAVHAQERGRLGPHDQGHRREPGGVSEVESPPMRRGLLKRQADRAPR